MYESDELVVGKVLSGDKAEYAKIIERYQQPLLRYVRRLVFDVDAAEDVVQETFISAYINLRSFNLKKKFSSWLYRIAHNRSIDYIRKHRRQLRPDESWWNSQASDGPSSADKLESKLRRDRVRQALISLPLKYREPLILHTYEKKSYRQISEILRLHPSTVGVRINRAKKMIKERMIKS